MAGQDGVSGNAGSTRFPSVHSRHRPLSFPVCHGAIPVAPRHALLRCPPSGSELLCIPSPASKKTLSQVLGAGVQAPPGGLPAGWMMLEGSAMSRRPARDAVDRRRAEPSGACVSDSPSMSSNRWCVSSSFPMLTGWRPTVACVCLTWWRPPTGAGRGGCAGVQEAAQVDGEVAAWCAPGSAACRSVEVSNDDDSQGILVHRMVGRRRLTGHETQSLSVCAMEIVRLAPAASCLHESADVLRSNSHRMRLCLGVRCHCYVSVPSGVPPKLCIAAVRLGWYSGPRHPEESWDSGFENRSSCSQALG